MIIQNKKRGNYEFGVGGQSISWRRGGVFLSTPQTIFLSQVGGSVNEVGGLNPPKPPPRQNEHWCYRLK